jgi:hypothetical protein
MVFKVRTKWNGVVAGRAVTGERNEKNEIFKL